MSTTLDFSVWPSAERPWAEVADLVAWAEDTGWHGFWYADHFMPNTDDERVVDGDVHEVWTILSAVAAVSSTLRLGSLVSPTTVRHPAVLANIAASLDRVSSGRLVLGIGAGWQINEHRAYGFDLLSPKDRVDRFEEAIQIVRSLLTEPRTTFSGRHFTFADAACQPTPVQSRLPLLVGTGGPRMTGITVRHADEWNVWGTPDTAGEKAATLDQACERLGREPRSIRRSVQAFFFLADDREKADRIRAKAPADRSVIGGPDEICAAIARYGDLGFDEIIVPDFSLGAGPEQRRASYARFVEEIIPNFR